LVSAVSWGAGDFAGGVATRLSNNVVAIFLAQGTGLLVAVLLLVLSQEAMPGAEALALASIAGAAGALGLGAFYLALSRGTMGIVAPLTALIGAIIPAVVGIARGDQVGVLVLVGMVVALAAVVLISLPERRVGSPALAAFRGSKAREWGLIIIAGVGFAGFFVFIDASHDAGGAVWWPLFMVKLAGTASVLAAGLVLAPLGRLPDLRPGRGALVMGVLAGMGDLGGNLFFVLASGVGELAVVVVLSSLYPVGTVLLARVILHERLGAVRIAGIALAIGGVVLIGFGSA
jgi:drug/metabolite transporter (DMT)-like permease